MSELLVNTIKKADGSGALTVPAESGTVVTTASPSLGRRNLIINGAMQVAQRGTSGAITTGGYTSLDRFVCFYGGFDQYVGTFSQVADAPSGFATSAKITTTTAETTVEASEYLALRHKIEGQNLQHLKYGTSSAETITLSFYVKSSVTGNYTVWAYRQGASQNRIRTFTYSISSADTWERKTIVITGDTNTLIPNDNTEGLEIAWVIAAGSAFTSTDSTSWVNYSDAALAYGHSQNGVTTTLNATFQITGVQLEVGSVATPFEHRSYGEELALCERYYQLYTNNGEQYAALLTLCNWSTGTVYGGFSFRTLMRSKPTYGLVGSLSDLKYLYAGTTYSPTTLDATYASETMTQLSMNVSTGNAGGAGWLRANSTANTGVSFDAEL